MQMREKIGKSRNTMFSQWFVASEGRKVGSLKRRVRSHLARREPLWREAHFQIKMYQTHHVRTTFGSWDVEKVHAVVARSTFPSLNVKNTRGSDHFWKLRCRKSAHRCGAKHISKSKCTKHLSLGPLLEVEKCTPLWREAHFQIKMYQTHHVRTTFGSWDVEKVHAVVARSTFPSLNVKNTRGSDHFWKLRCRKSAHRCGAKHISKSKCTKHLSLGPLLEVEKCTPLRREAHVQIKMYQTHHVRTTFGSWDVEKVHAVVARSTFPSLNVKNTRGSDHFWKLRCRKSARRCGAKHISKSKCTKHTIVGPLLEGEMSKKCICGAKHISKSKCTKHTILGPLLEVEMSKKCTLLWRAAHFEVKMLKAPGVRTTFGRWDVVPHGRCEGVVDLVESEQNVRVLSQFQKRWQAWGFWWGSAKMHFPWQAQYKRHVHERC